MASPTSHKSVFSFGPFEADPDGGQLLRHGSRVRLQDQPFRLLLLLLERPGEVITREELREKLWPHNTFVEFDNGLNVAAKKVRYALGDSAESPRFIETVPRRGYRFIAPVSIKASGAEPPAALDPRLSVPSPAQPARPRWRWLPYAVGALLAVLIAAGVLIARFTARSSRRSAATNAVPAPVPARRTVAVMEFRNVSGRRSDEWLSTAISEMLITELGAGEQLHMVPAEDVARMQRELHVAGGSLARETAVGAGKNLNADMLVSGSFTVMGSGSARRVRVDARMQELAHGEMVAEVAEVADEPHLFELAERAGTRLREALGVPGVSPVEQAAARAALPFNPVASRLYLEGLARLRIVDAIGARDLLEHAIAAEPDFPLSHLALAWAWRALGYEQKAQNEAKRALDLSSRLPRGERLQIEGRYYQLSGDIDRAISAYRALFALFPDSLEDGLLLAEAQVWGAKPADALVTVESLRLLPAPVSQDPRIDMQQARALAAMGREGGLAYLRQAEEKARLQGAPLLAAKAQIGECITLNAASQFEEGARACQAAYSAFAVAGNPSDTAQSLRHLGDARQSQGRLEEALGLYEQALTINQSVGDNTGVAISINQMAILYENRGDLAEAEKLYRRSYALFLKVGHRLNAAVLAGNVAGILLQQAKLSAAERAAAKSMALARENGNKPAEAQARKLLAELALVRGDLEQARRETQSAQELEPQGDNVGHYEALMRLSQILFAQDDLAGARHNCAEAVALAEKIGARNLAAQASVALAEIDLEDGHPDRAEQPIRDALSVFRNEKMQDSQLNGHALLSRALLMQGKVKEAQSVLSEAREELAHSQNHATRMRFTMAEAQVTTAAAPAGHPDRAARSELVQCIAEAKTLGLAPLQYEAELALAGIEINNNLPVDRQELSSLEKAAHARGLERIARRAAGLRNLSNQHPAASTQLFPH